MGFELLDFTNSIKLNYWDFIYKKRFTTNRVGIPKLHQINTYLVPLWIVNTVRLTLEDSNLILYKACTWLDFGVYTKTRIEAAHIAELLKRVNEPLQDILNKKIELKKWSNEVHDY